MHNLPGILKKIIILLLLSRFYNIYTQNTNEHNKAKLCLQSRGEVYLKAVCSNNTIKDQLLNAASVDRICGDSVFLYVNELGFKVIQRMNLDFEVLTPPSMRLTKFIKKRASNNWNYYPHYDEYVNMMENFSNKHHRLCKLVKFGESVGGKELLAIKISDYVDTDESEPEFFYTSSIHGDETGGFVLLLRLIDFLLENYTISQDIRELVNETEIWINPLSNPDGTFYLSDTSVYGAKRFNLNNVDLNRNFPDPEGGDHPDGNNWQPENIAMMDFMAKRHFVLSANIHAGAEVINYPWDTWERKHADDAWYRKIARNYVDTVFKHAPWYYMNPSWSDMGIINGYQWYRVEGGRQDYVNYFMHSREVTMELDGKKITPENELSDLWIYNYRSLLYYISECHKGINGIIRDGSTEEPIKAKIEIKHYDRDHSQVLSHDITGEYYRLLESGLYEINYSAEGYEDTTLTINYQYGVPQSIDVHLNPIMKNKTVQKYNKPFTLNNPVYDKLIIDFTPSLFRRMVHIKITDLSGKCVYYSRRMIVKDQMNVNMKHLKTGVYIVSISSDSYNFQEKLMKSSVPW